MRHSPIGLGLSLAWLSVAPLSAQDPLPMEGLGNVQSIATQGEDRIVTCTRGRLRLQVCTPTLVRVSIATGSADFPADEPELVVRYQWPPVTTAVEDTPQRLSLRTDGLVLDLDKSPLRLSLSTPDRTRLLTRTAPDGLAGGADGRQVRMDLDAGGTPEHFFGLGMQFWSGDLRGRERKVAMFQNYSAREEGLGETHYVNPFLLSTNGYGIYLHTAAPSRFDLGATSPGAYTFAPDLGGLDVYLFAGPEFAPMIRTFNELCGMPTMPPRYALGLAYRGAEKDGSGAKLLDAVKKYRQAGVPLDIAGTEPSWQTARGTHVWSPSYVQDPTAWITELRDLGVRVNLWERDEFIPGRMPDYTGLEPHIAKGKTQHLADLTRPEARAAWFAGARKVAFDRGAQGFKVDENEHWDPIPGATMPSGMPQEMYANLHPTLVQKTYVEGCRTAFNQRYFGWSRGGFTGAQRYPVPGYTDASDFSDYIRATVNMGFWGAYFCPEYRATSDRIIPRLQMMFLAPYALDNEWVTGAVPAVGKNGEANPVYLAYARLRYRLIPYLYAAFWEQHRTGLPVVRHTLTEFPRDGRAWRQDLQYFLGRDLLVAPLYENPRQIYLPEGTWIDFWTGDRVVGGRAMSWHAKNGDLPLFLRAGAVLPLQPDMDFVDQKPVDPLTLLIAPGNSPKEGATFYEDDGLSYDFERGDFAETTLRQTQSSPTELRLTIGAVRTPGKFRPIPRMLVVQALANGPAAEVAVDGRTLPLLDAAAQAVANREGYWNTSDRQGTVWVRVTSQDQGRTLTIRLAKPLNDQERWRTAYATEVDGAKKRLESLRSAAAKAETAILATALAEAESLASKPEHLPQALARLNLAGDSLADLAGAGTTESLVAVEAQTLKNGNVTSGFGDPKKDHLVRHDGADPSNEARMLVSFSLVGVKTPPASAQLSLSCLDAGTPLPGHDAIHLMLYVLNRDPDLAKATWANTPLDAGAVTPVVDFFPVKNATVKLDVTAAITQALAAKRTRITFVLDSLDDMGKGRPLVFAGLKHFENKALQPTLVLRHPPSGP